MPVKYDDIKGSLPRELREELERGGVRGAKRGSRKGLLDIPSGPVVPLFVGIGCAGQQVWRVCCECKSSVMDGPDYCEWCAD